MQGGGQITAAADHTHYALVGQPAEQLLPIRVKLRIVIMGVGVKNRSIFHKSNSFIKKSEWGPQTARSFVFLANLGAGGHTVHKQHLYIMIADIAGQKHTVAHFAAQLGRL